MSGQFSAQAQKPALGYLYQVRYALLLLIEAGIEDPDAQISLECLDDVAFEKNGTPTELIQTKHHVNSKASLSDASPDLWKTLRVWSEASLQGKLQLENILLTLITTESVSVNSAASRLRSSSFTPRNVDEILELLLAVAQSSENKINKPAYEAFLRLSQDQQRMLLKNIRILDGSPDILAVQKEAVNYLRLSTREKFLQAVYERLEGWWFATAIRHLASHTSTIIQYRDLHVMLNDIQEQFYEENLPLDYLEPLEAKEHEAEEDQRVFVEQLRLIDVRIKRIQKAIGDFYRSSSQRSRWVRDGVLFMNELEQYEARLCDEWERRYEIMQENFPHNPTEEDIQKCGKTLFNEVEQASLHIRSRCTAEYIMRGSYHILADQLHVGWHVNFRSRLRKMLP